MENIEQKKKIGICYYTGVESLGQDVVVIQSGVWSCVEFSEPRRQKVIRELRDLLHFSRIIFEYSDQFCAYDDQGNIMDLPSDLMLTCRSKLIGYYDEGIFDLALAKV